jgi:hypothetical protein
MSGESDAAHAIEQALRYEHRCGPRCPSCRAYRRALRPEGLLERFGELVAGESGWRYARAHAENDLPFPQFSSDPHEQFLVCEALSVRYDASRRQAEEAQEARVSAENEAHERLAAYRQGAGP